jgi:PIN domain nuclease of toxin-antitoxin system
MILLDTHIWIWWTNGSLNTEHSKLIAYHQNKGFAISIISCWEVAKLVEYNRLELRCSVNEWLKKAVAKPEFYLLDIDIPILVESTQLLQPFHRDPADQIIVATARIYDLSLFTVDQKILNYPHVKTLS